MCNLSVFNYSLNRYILNKILSISSVLIIHSTCRVGNIIKRTCDSTCGVERRTTGTDRPTTEMRWRHVPNRKRALQHYSWKLQTITDVMPPPKDARQTIPFTASSELSQNEEYERRGWTERSEKWETILPINHLGRHFAPKNLFAIFHNLSKRSVTIKITHTHN